MVQRKLVHIAILLCTCIGVVWGVPAPNTPIVRINEDGSRDTIYLYGDEHCSFRSTKKDAVFPSSFESTIKRAPQKKDIYSYVPSQGKVRIPVILVNFADLSFTINDPVAQFDDLFNGKGGSNPNATGSVHNYFTASSNDALDLSFEVHGPYTLSRDMAYYGSNVTNSKGVTTNHSVHADSLVIEAVRLAVANGVDMSVYDNEGDGNIDNVSVVVAGYNEAEGGPENSIWPHYSEIQRSGTYSGKRVTGYLVISEYHGSGGRVQAGIGTYCHEFGHALGLPDLYNTAKSDTYTVGTWDIMCSGCYNNNGSTPPSYTAFERFMMNWLVPKQVLSSEQHLLEPIETSNQALLVAAKPHNLNNESPSPSEYFLIENRQAVGWDAGKEALVSTGLLVSHITFNIQNWNYNTFNNATPLGFAIVSAGMDQATRSSAADVFPGSTKRTSWLPTLNDGTTLKQYNISRIQQRNDGNMFFLVGEVGDMALEFDQEEVSMTTTYLASPFSYDTARIMLNINKAQDDTICFSLSSDLFRYSIDEGEHWYSNKETATMRIPRDSVFSIPILAIHTPRRRNCESVYAFLSVQTSDGNANAQITLAGTAPRPIFITQPKIDSVTNISTTSFSVSWEPQEDAELYYYALYTIGNGESEEADDQTIHLTTDGQTVFTKEYLYPPHWISIWLSNDYTPNSIDENIGGQIHVWGAADDDNWQLIQMLPVQQTTKNIDRDIEIDTTQHYTHFKLVYTHIGGSGGAIIKYWTAHWDFSIHYIFELEQYTIYAPGYTAMFRSLEPQTTYYFAVQAYEEKGCTPHYSKLSSPIAVTTHQPSQDTTLHITRDDNGQYTIHLPDMSDGLQTIAIYDRKGLLLKQWRPPYGATTTTIPPLNRGQLYIAKYYKKSIKRKDLYGKFIYY